MLEELGHPDAADSVLQAIRHVHAAGGPRTPDLGGTSSTDEVGDAFARALAVGAHRILGLADRDLKRLESEEVI